MAADALGMAQFPVFIKANFTFSVKNNTYTFTNHSISNFGIASLRWPYFDPAEIVGNEISLDVDVLSKPHYRFTTRGHVMAEETGTANYLGVQFVLDPKTNEELTQIIRAEGFHPTQHIRKYPRIPALAEIGAMPIRAVAVHDSGEVFTFDIANISPTGTLLRTENPRSGFFLPRQRIRLQLEPRGDVIMPIKLEGVICRTFFMKNLKTGNIVRSFGIKFVKIAESDRQNFLEILRLVLNNLKNIKLR